MALFDLVLRERDSNPFLDSYDRFYDFMESNLPNLAMKMNTSGAIAEDVATTFWYLGGGLTGI